MNATALLSLNNRTKVIPAGSSDEPSATSRFRLLKTRPEAAAGISGAEANGALRDALVKINADTTPFFTTGCGRSCNGQMGGFWTRGYLDIAFNYIEIAKDSPNYFLLFEQFNRHVLESGFDVPVEFNFQLQAAHFEKIAAVGYTTCVWITTAEFPSPDDSEKAWNQGVCFLKDFLCSFEKPELSPIY